eukprot:1159891-Pelagomonas_calceolata.AAC.3
MGYCWAVHRWSTRLPAQNVQIVPPSRCWERTGWCSSRMTKVWGSTGMQSCLEPQDHAWAVLATGDEGARDQGCAIMLACA